MSIKLNHTRFKDLPWYGEPLEIILGGLGGIGSFYNFFLGRVGHTIYAFEDSSNVLEESNLAGQLYMNNQMGQIKFQAAQYNTFQFSKNSNMENMGRYEEDSLSGPYVIAAFDNILARKHMFENWLKQEDKEFYQDLRMQAEYGEIFTITKHTLDKVEEYRKYLFDDSEVPSLPCTAKATSHCGAILAGMGESILNNYIANQRSNDDGREVPFKLSYDLYWFNFKLEDK